MTDIIQQLGDALDAIDLKFCLVYEAYPRMTDELNAIVEELARRRQAYFEAIHDPVVEAHWAYLEARKYVTLARLNHYIGIANATYHFDELIKKAGCEWSTERERIDSEVARAAAGLRADVADQRYHEQFRERLAAELAERIANKNGKTTRPRKRRSVVIDGERVKLETTS
jgi:hypothetical protein